jgi:hypothetical protein
MAAAALATLRSRGRSHDVRYCVAVGVGTHCSVSLKVHTLAKADNDIAFQKRAGGGLHMSLRQPQAGLVTREKVP